MFFVYFPQKYKMFYTCIPQIYKILSYLVITERELQESLCF